MIDLIVKIIYAIIIFSGTTICGIPITFYFIKTGRWLSKIILSFCIGFILLALGGIVANLLLINVFFTQFFILIICIITIIPIRTTLKAELDRNDWIILIFSTVYVISLISFFDWIVMWMAGDAVTHASIIRMLVDGQSLPISLPPFGTYWEIYPKAFHFYSFFWGSGSSILTTIQVIPVLITAIIPITIYSLIRELKKDEIAFYAFIFSAICFSQHYVYLIWAGYPSAAAEMLLVAGVLTIFVEKRLLPLILVGILFTHTRYLGIFFGILLVWLIIEIWNEKQTQIKRFYPYIILFIGVGLVMIMLTVPFHKPDFFLSLISNKQIASDFIARWFWGILSIFGLVIAVYRKDNLDRFTVAATIALIGLAIAVDTRVLSLSSLPDRIISLLYIPLSIFAAYTVVAIVNSKREIKTGVVLLIIAIGALSMGAIFYSYAGSWALPKEDYQAMEWLGAQNLSGYTCINIDDTGAWIYPITGIQVANLPYLIVGVDQYNQNYVLIRSIIRDPNSAQTRDRVNMIQRPLIYLSHTSMSMPGYTPPFSATDAKFPAINHTYSEKNYQLRYGDGVKIFEPIQ
ncbi:MAG: hypothetical protein M0R30_08905 [Methanoregula sp.]|uniref:hypothetical protein n=1 Tax=Methanoregula sp. TaxID=2052170 RepID=UPI0025EF6090|nr:hypothetical protein [Methanoregula sp.]MCK9631751.1 hypothetical protein [Methanoregula sp.]